MGYYATGGGTIAFKKPQTESAQKEISEILSSALFDCDWFNQHFETDVWFDAKYYSDNVFDALQKIASKYPVRSGLIEFSGEDGAHWKLEYKPKTSTWQEYGGTVVYDDDIVPVSKNDRAHFVGLLIDVFEDFLESKGIDIPNPDKTQSDNPAILYGMDYGEIQSGIEDVLREWNVIEKW